MPYKVKGKCVYKKDGGAKVGCTKGPVSKYLAALHANANESTKDLIKRLVRENIGLESQRGAESTFHVKEKGEIVGTVSVCPANRTFGKDTMEISNISFPQGVINLEIGKKTLIALFEHYPDIERIVIQPKPESRDFWFKLDAQRINDDFMIVFRAH